MTDEEFLTYVASYAETPFSKQEVARLLRLAGFMPLARSVELGSRKFYPLHTNEVESYVKRAREIMTTARAAVEAKASSLRVLARQYQMAAEQALDQ